MRPSSAAMNIPDLSAHDEHASVLLKKILGIIHLTFPQAQLTINAHPSNNDIVFNIQREDGTRNVEVTEAFLDADDGLNSALHCLVDLQAQLGRLAPGDILMVTDVGLRMHPLRPFRALHRVILAAQVIGLNDWLSLVAVGCV
jgi:hypothetical protein